MPEKEIPADVRWKYASRCAAMLPAMYDIAFREALKSGYAEAEQEIWMELSRTVEAIVHDLSLPKKTAPDIARGIFTALSILFGPELSGEIIGHSDDRAVIIVKRCPFIVHGIMLGADCGTSFSRCMALVLTAVPLINKNYSARFVRTMCTGDRQCEIKIEIAPVSGDKEKKTDGKTITS